MLRSLDLPTLRSRDPLMPKNPVMHLIPKTRLMEPQNPNRQWTVLQNQNLDPLMPKSLDLQIPRRPTSLIRISGISLIGSLMLLILNLDLQMPNPRLMEPQN